MRRVRRSVIVPATPADVWDAVIDPQRLGEWLGGTVTIEPEVGAPLTFEERDAVWHGFVIDVTPRRTLELWWAPDDDGGASTVRIDLEPHPEGTEVTVTEELAPVELAMTAPRFVRQAGFGDRPLAVVR